MEQLSGPMQGQIHDLKNTMHDAGAAYKKTNAAIQSGHYQQAMKDATSGYKQLRHDSNTLKADMKKDQHMQQNLAQ
jgi:hypothetical protein